MKERCDFCDQDVPLEHVCRFVPDGEHYEEICLVVCKGCLERTGVAYWTDGRFRKAQDPVAQAPPVTGSESKS